MFAVVRTGGKQYKVHVGETIDVEKLAVEQGTHVRLDEVLLAANDGSVAFGRPVIDGAVVTARVVRQHKGPKLIVFKYKSKSRYRRRTGHRQNLTQLLVQSIAVPGWETVELPARPTPTPEVEAFAPEAPAPEAPAPEASAPEAPVAIDMVDGVASEVTDGAGGVDGAAVSGSAAPPGDALPAIDPTAQLHAADTIPDIAPGAALDESAGGITNRGMHEPGEEA